MHAYTHTHTEHLIFVANTFFLHAWVDILVHVALSSNEVALELSQKDQRLRLSSLFTRGRWQNSVLMYGAFFFFSFYKYILITKQVYLQSMFHSTKIYNACSNWTNINNWGTVALNKLRKSQDNQQMSTMEESSLLLSDARQNNLTVLIRLHADFILWHKNYH